MKFRDRIRALFKPALPADEQLVVAVGEVLRNYAAALEEHAAAPPPRTGMWIMTPTFDHEAWARELAAVIVDRERAIRTEAAVRALQGAKVSCECRCRAHGRGGCPRCLTVERCPLHFEPDPTALREP